MVYHGRSNTKGQPTIDYEELTRRNKYATLRIQEGSAVNLVVKQIPSQLIHCHIQDRNSEFQSDLTIVYGLHTIADRRALWDQLRDINAVTNGPWLIMGDFNSVLSVEDRINGVPVHQNEVVDFKQCISDIGVGLINKKGMQFSWSNKRGAEDGIYGHIDWAFGNAEWFWLYAGIEAIYLVPGCSDHIPILLNTEVHRMKVKKPYRLLTVMLQQEEYKAAVENVWRQDLQGYTMYAIYPAGVYTIFQELLGEAAPVMPGIDVNIVRDGPCLSMAQQQQMLRPVTEEEITRVVQELPNDKAPGIDGYPAEFFKENWEVIGEDVIKVVIQFFETRKLLREINCTTVTLIPKVTNPNYVKEFRPIACCSTMYKIIAKLLTTRLKSVVDYLVGPSQSAFIEGRNILENVILAHELIKGYNQKKVSPRCTVKVDIRKAYDSVDWNFLRALMLEFGILGKMVKLIMECVSTVSYSLLINEGLTPKFQAKKGLRQGDPMSPYLFILVMEYLNRSLKQLKSNSDFNYHPKCARLGIVHICFADDLLMCCRADKVSIELIMTQFEKFSTASGLQANMEKSSFYVAGISNQHKQKILEKLKFTNGEIPFKYLGVPLSSKKPTISQCMPLVDRIAGRARCWTTRFLSYAGRVQLIKSVLFEMQTYWAQVFMIPKKVHDMVTEICRNFLWHGSNEGKKAPISWDTICKPKAAGGLNIINFSMWNRAAIGKLLWVIAQKKDKLWVMWIHNHYIKKKEMENMETPKEASWVVRKIFEARKRLNTGIQELELYVIQGKYTISKAYHSFMPQYPKVTWKTLYMTRGMIPRHQFILWMAMHRRLATVDRLIRWGIPVPAECVLCMTDEEETHDHLFFECSYSKFIWKQLLSLFGNDRQVGGWQEEIEWMATKTKSRNTKWKILGNAFAATFDPCMNFYMVSESSAIKSHSQNSETLRILRQLSKSAETKTEEAELVSS
ncbi:PREDICTED: uncharacterized protein LOC109242998 [Nicotiana attenuata]|uniref:uncharacterized protein LOC109242998 n=1 Tax=Nicotiana attenuata TaxID=49451 RepID=UPI000904DCDB|nr:PREDICTED: uncharacterized protein LOC109242998 [Nicotiana attenuata]